MRVIRAHDGVAFDFQHLHLKTVRNVQDFVETVGPDIAIESSSLMVITPSGSLLTDAILAHALDVMSGTSTGQASLHLHDDDHAGNVSLLYAFDRRFWGVDAGEAAAHLVVRLDDLVSTPVTPYDPAGHSASDASALAYAHRKVAAHHVEITAGLLSHIRSQKAAITVALANLVKYSESTIDPWKTLEMSSQPAIAAFGNLLESFEPSMALAKRVRVLGGVIEGAVGVSTGSTGRIKYMGDYVSPEKIGIIRDRCAKVYDDLRHRSEELQQTANSFTAVQQNTTDRLQNGEGDIDDLQDLERDAEDGYLRVLEDVDNVMSLSPEDVDPECIGPIFEELQLLDEDARARLDCLVERKNGLILYALETFSTIATSQAALAAIPSAAQTLNHDLSTRTDSFKHLARLKDLITAYALTVVEVVRRREFRRHLLDHSVALAGVLSNLSSDERKRRLAFQNTHGGKMPFDIRGLDDVSVPTVDVEVKLPTNSPLRQGKVNDDNLPSLTRADIDELLVIFREIDQAPQDYNDPELELARSPAGAARLLIEEGLIKLEEMEQAFARAADRTVMTDSELMAQSGHGARHDEENKNLRQELSDNADVIANLRLQLHERIDSRDASRERSNLEAQASQDVLKERINTAEGESSQLRTQLADERRKLQDAEKRHTVAIQAMSEKLSGLEYENRSSQTTVLELERQLTSARATADHATRELGDLANRHNDHLSDRSTLEHSLQQIRERARWLESELDRVRVDKDKQADLLAEKDRQLRDLRSEAECDLAVLENEVKVLKSDIVIKVETTEAQSHLITELESERDLLKQRHATTFHEQLQSRDSESGRSDRLQSNLDVLVPRVQTLALYAQRIRVSVDRTVDRLSSMPPPGSSTKSIPEVSSMLSTVDEDFEIPHPLSPGFDDFLATFARINLDSYATAVQKKADSLSLLVRKWMKESKGYRERAHRAQDAAKTKISVRQFSVGDLALFLPTRNVATQCWAAFNVGFPHYFLQNSPAIEKMTKGREFLVARIQSITGNTIHPKDASANPYSLPPGTRYWLLDIEGAWTPDPRPSPRKSESTPTVRSAPSKSAVPESVMASSTLNQRRSLSSVDPIPIPPSPLAHSSLPDHFPMSYVGFGSSKIMEDETMDSSPLSAINVAGSPGAEDPFLPLGGGEPSISHQPRRNPPSGIAISLARSGKLSDASRSPVHSVKNWPIPNIPISDCISEASFRPSESARPAFLSTLGPSILTLQTSQSPSQSMGDSSHTQSRSPSAALLKLPRRPIPRASIRRSPSHSSSTASIRPNIAALLKQTGSSPLSKGSYTIATTVDTSSIPVEEDDDWASVRGQNTWDTLPRGFDRRAASTSNIPTVVTGVGIAPALLSRSPAPPYSNSGITSSIFGTWRRRKDSTFGGASELLKRFNHDK